MTDYEQLVEALRCKRDDCEGCGLAFFDEDEGWMCQYAAKDDDAADAIEALQAELNSRTIYGYPVDKLIMFAEMCKRNDVQERDLKQAAWNLELAVRAVMNERQEIIINAVGEITMRCTPDFVKAFEEMRDGAKMEEKC